MSSMTLMEKVRVMAEIDREIAKETALFVEGWNDGVLISVEDVPLFNHKRCVGQKRMYQELCGDIIDPFFTKNGETWVDGRLLKAYYDFKELPFDDSYELFWKYHLRKLEREGTSIERTELEEEYFEFRRAFNNRRIRLDAALAFVSFMRINTVFLKVCDEKNEEHFLELVTLTASRSVQDFLFARANEVFQYREVGGVKVEC